MYVIIKRKKIIVSVYICFSDAYFFRLELNIYIYALAAEFLYVLSVRYYIFIHTAKTNEIIFLLTISNFYLFSS